MSLNIDSTRALLRPSELWALVTAVRDADGHEEHRWIEWKSTLDLRTAKGLAHIAKAVVGFANRQPSAAARHADGYGYLLVGVAPGAVAGVQPLDPEILVGQVRAAVGDAVRWTPEYVRVNDREVLVVIIDPPKPGDPIHCLRKQVDRYQPGTIFVRHTGRTDQATPSDIDMLQSRVLARSETLRLVVTAEPSALEAMPDIGAAVARWTTRRRTVLRASRFELPAGVLPGSLEAKIAKTELLSRVGLSGLRATPDTRTEEQYYEQIEKYLTVAQASLVNRGQWYFYRHEPAQLRVHVSNPADIGVKAIRLRIHIPGNVNAVPDGIRHLVEGGRPTLPEVPPPLGTPLDPVENLIRASEYRRWIPVDSLSARSSDSGLRPAFIVADSGSVTIDYRDFDLRPGEHLALAPVPLWAREKAGTSVTATWRATGDGIRGLLSGEINLVHTASTLDLETLDSEDDRK
ncbi:helix-turn-helix domain-containing protein [Solwaraspora sp. WMMB335]|uniref:AlbA family DNA-binding domain-containing protein n=1 Tax=Solwaraspora sp. WMMB335 TaxID=3404118 RepID=UPI003B94C8C8